MDDDGLVIAVRLLDTEEREQPDPLCLRSEDLATWRHFESLLCDMFTHPPAAIKVSYLDDENDWVELSSDGELKEAVTLTKNGGEILQLRVKRLDDETSKLIPAEVLQEEVTLRPNNAVYYVPTTDPGGDVLETLIYPYPISVDSNNSPASIPTAPVIPEPQVLVYPYPKEEVKEHASEAPMENSDLLQQLIPSLPAGDGLVSDSPADVCTERPVQDQQISTLAIPWDQANTLSLEKKIYYLKSMVTSGTHPMDNEQASGEKEQGPLKEGVLLADFPSLNAVVVTKPKTLCQNFIPNQDPFELDCDGTPEEGARRFSQKMSSPTLIPTSAAKDANSSQSKGSSKEKDGGASHIATPAKLLDWVSTLHSAMSFTTIPPSPPPPESPVYSAAIPKCKLAKKTSEKSGFPKPLPRNLLMMDGAPSGANAVAIEMPPEPDFFHHPVNKEEEIAASGGASSTSASEETGEVLTRAGSDAAAVSREMKAFAPRSGDLFNMTVPDSETVAHKLEKRPAKRAEVKVKTCGSARKERSTSEKRERSMSERKEKSVDKKDPSVSKVKSEKAKSGEHKKKTDVSHRELKKKVEDKKVITEDVESGEKVRVKDEPGLKMKALVKLLEQLKRDMRKSIVQDVTKQTESLLHAIIETQKVQVPTETRCNKSDVIHEGIYCDHCNEVIQGVRYKCGNCIDYDLCQQCEGLPGIHIPTHVFLKMKYPRRNAGLVGYEKLPLLRENIYTPRPEDLQAESLQSVHVERLLTHLGLVDDKGEEPVGSINEPHKVIEETDLTVERVAQTCLSLDVTQDCEQGDRDVVPLAKLLPAEPTAQNLMDQEGPSSPANSESRSSSIVSLTYNCIPLVALTRAKMIGDMAGQQMSADTAVVSLEDLEISPPRRPESPNQPIFLEMEEDSSFQEWDSDSSDDFCIIEPSHSQFSRDDYEALPGEDHEQLLSTSNVDQSQIEEDEPVIIESEGQGNGSDLEEKEEVEEEAQAEPEENLAVTDSAHSIQDDLLVHRMNEEEKMRYKHLLQTELLEEQARKRELAREQELERAEMEQALREQELERAKMEQALRELELERLQREELKRAQRDQELERMQREQDFRNILEAKEKEAAIINETLEKAAQQKEMEDRRTKLQASLSQSSEESVSKRDVDCQTNPEVFIPASHIIHNVASGVSKAATTAYHTAKDVFYSLQAKQNEWKAPVSSYKPPQSPWKLPESTWTPPQDNFVPPTSKWTPPQSDFTLPPACLENSDTDSQAAGTATDASTAAGKRQSPGSRPMSLVEGSDSELTRELKSMQHLIEMGFANRERNRQLLGKFDGDLEKVVQSLLQEEGDTGEHWAIHRH